MESIRAISVGDYAAEPIPAPRVSVIVPVRNGGEGLETLIEALREQTLPRETFEVIIGDDGSTDGVSARAKTSDGWVRVTAGPPLTSYAARNRAAGISSAPVLAFCDADCTPEPDWLEQGLVAIESADLVAGKIRFTLTRRNVWALVEIDAFKDHARQVRSANAETANLFVRRSVYSRVGGFDASLPSHGDFDFVSRCVAGGARLAYGPEAVVTHATRSSASWFLKKTWISNWAYAVREGRRGRRPYGARLRWWIPLVSRIRARRRFGQPLGLDKAWLMEHDVSPSLGERLAALPIMYLAVPYLQAGAQVAGWIHGRKERRAGDAQTLLDASPLWQAVDALADEAPSLEDLRIHGLHLLAAQRLRGKGLVVPADLVDAERIAAFRTIGLQLLLREIRAATSAPLYLIKGPEIALYYPDPGVRDFGDIDILVSDAPSVQRDLLEAGFQLVGDPTLYEDIHHLRPLWRPGSPMVVEIHSEPKWVEPLRPPSFAQIAAYGIPSSALDGFFTLRPEAHAVLVAVHSWAHEPLARIAHLAEVAALLAAGDRALADTIAREWAVERVWRVTLAAADALFLGERQSFPLRTWARSARSARGQTVLESHLSRLMAPVAAFGSKGLAVVWRNAIDDLRPLPDESWREKLDRSRTAFRNARSRRLHHVRELGGGRHEPPV